MTLIMILEGEIRIKNLIKYINILHVQKNCIEITSERALVESLVAAIPLLDESGYNKETLQVEYEWQPPRCETCNTFRHLNDQCPKKVKVAISKVVMDDGFIEVTRKSGKGKQTSKYETRHIDDIRLSKSKTRYYYRPKAKQSKETGNEATTSTKKGNGNSASEQVWDLLEENPTLDNEEGSENDEIEHVYDETSNYMKNTTVNVGQVGASSGGKHSRNRGKLWCLMGDFNSALNLEDKLVGSSIIDIDISMREFKKCVEEIEVSDVNR
ncbi:hypothetical protein Tco_1096039 [Tanacetum coccineum]